MYLPVGAAMAVFEPGSRVTGRPGKLNPKQLAAGADFIIVGKVASIAYYQQGTGNIYTLATLAVEQNIKGKTEAEVVIRVPGGEAGGLSLMVTDNPGFRKGERALVFLKKDEGNFTVVGGLYGKVTIDENNAVGGKPLTGFIEQFKDITARQ
jgi:hypothetical protein